MKKSRWILSIVGLVVVALLLTGYMIIRRGKEKVSPYRTALVDRGDVRVNVSATGTLTAVTTVQVGSQVSGTIAALHADYNDHVKKGETLAQLDPTFLKAQVAQSEADLQKDQVNLAQAKRDLDRQKPLRDQGLASQAEIDATETAYEAAQATVKSSQAGLDRARTNLEYATINSPIDGVVVSRNVDVGQTVAASLSAPTLFTIANDLAQMQLDASVDEADIGQVAVGQKVTFTVDAFPDRTFGGAVKQIRLAPQTVQNVVSYDVIVLVANPDLKLLPGMTANATFLISETDNTLRVPVAALRFRPPQMAMNSGGGSDQKSGAGVTQGGSTSAGATRAGGAQGGATRGNGALAGGSTRGGSGMRGAGGSQADSGMHGGRMPGGTAGGGGWQGGSGNGQVPRRVLIWTLDAGNKLHPVRVRPGASDGTYTAVSSDSLREGMAVVIGMNQQSASAGQQTVNPFVPGGGGAARGGRR
jgi:HlyD family secretion protein